MHGIHWVRQPKPQYPAHANLVIALEPGRYITLRPIRHASRTTRSQKPYPSRRKPCLRDNYDRCQHICWLHTLLWFRCPRHKIMKVDRVLSRQSRKPVLGPASDKLSNIYVHCAVIVSVTKPTVLWLDFNERARSYKRPIKDCQGNIRHGVWWS